jgi:hypothetical protein
MFEVTSNWRLPSCEAREWEENKREVEKETLDNFGKQAIMEVRNSLAQNLERMPKNHRETIKFILSL